jgi:hypothetical protein
VIARHYGAGPVISILQILGVARAPHNQPSWLFLTAEVRHPAVIPLRLRRAADQFPRARWESSNEQFVVMSGETVVGSLKRQTGGTASDRWFGRSPAC